MTKNQHLLVKVSEECAEISQVACKAIIFGPKNHAPGDYDTDNANDIITEYYQLTAIIEMLQEEKVLPIYDEEKINDIKSDKKSRIKSWMKYSDKLGYTQLKRGDK